MHASTSSLQLSEADELELLRLLEDEAIDNARERILPFTLYVRPKYRANWHHEVVCRALDRFVAGDIKRLMLFMPPRNGKSELVSRCLPSYILGRDPDASIIATSYGADLASMMNRDVQRIIESDAYARLFPATRLNGSNVRTLSGAWMRNSDLFEIVGREGIYRSAGVGGGITGMGADFAIIDDVIKNMKEAMSQAYRDAVWDWYSSTLYTRLQDDNARVLVTLTRWHEDDLAGRLLDQSKNDPEADQWEVINLPAIKEHASADSGANDYDKRQAGEPLWPDRFGMKRLAKIKATVTPSVWSALFQQRPSPASGKILLKQWWRFWYPANQPAPKPWTITLDDNVVHVAQQKAIPERLTEGQSWDLTFKDTTESAFVVGQQWGYRDGEDFLLDQVRDRMEIVRTLHAIVALRERYPRTQATLIEEKANGAAVMSVLKGKIPGIVAVQPDGSKEARAHAASTFVFAGNVWLPHPTLFPWVKDFIEECAMFPNSKFKDQVDTLTQWVNHRHKDGANVLERITKL